MLLQEVCSTDGELYFRYHTVYYLEEIRRRSQRKRKYIELRKVKLRQNFYS